MAKPKVMPQSSDEEFIQPGTVGIKLLIETLHSLRFGYCDKDAQDDFIENIQGEFQYPTTLIILNSNKGVFLKDVDNDGDLDILALGNRYVKLLEMQGSTIQSTTTLV